MIPRELIKRLKRIEIHTAKLANEQLAGSYHSVFKGRGMAFSEVRQYQSGDDVRFIDWNVSARMNEAYVKLFTEEREITVMLLVDLSASQEFGTQNKSKVEVLAEAAALIAFSAIKNNDRVGLILFTDRVERFVPPKKGKAHVMRVIAEILNAKPKYPGTNIGAALDTLNGFARRRSIAFLFSDFQSQGFDKPFRVAARKHDLIPVQLVDPREENLPAAGLALFEDLESGELYEVDTDSRAFRDWYHRSAAQSRAARERMFRQQKLDHVRLMTDGDALKPLVDLFRRRQRRLRGAS